MLVDVTRVRRQLPSVGSLARRIDPIDPTTPIPAVAARFRTDPDLDRLVVASDDGPWLLTRDAFDDRVSDLVVSIAGVPAASTIARFATRPLACFDAGDDCESVLRALVVDDRLAEGVVLVTTDDGPALAAVSDVTAAVCDLTRALVVTADAERERFEYQATRDPLTRLWNRFAFLEGFRSLASAGQRVGLALIDLDGFAELNEIHGYDVGDRLLAVVADRMLGIAGSVALAARVGGDEFALVVPGDHDAWDLVQQVLGAIRRPIVVDGFEHHLGARAGLLDARGRGLSAEDAMSRAALALAGAKGSGRAACVRFHPSMLEEAVQRTLMRDRIDRGLVGGQFSLVYQPKVDLGATGRLELEALVRWTDPMVGRISPADFIPIAEQTGRIVPLGWWVLDAALADIARWRRDGVDVAVGVNVSPRQLLAEDFADRVADRLAFHGLTSDALEIELTETALIEDPDAVCRTLGALRCAGVRVAVDDYGSGHASIAYLRQLPIDVIKVDRSMILMLDDEPAAGEALLASITSLARALGLVCVAEGIETVEQDAAIRKLGFDYGQGYFYQPPIPGPKIAASLGLPEDAPGLTTPTG